MVLERIISPKQIEGHPWELFFVGGFHANVALVAAFVLVQKFSSLTSVAFTTMLTLPFVYYSLDREEELYMKDVGEAALLQKHLTFFKKFMYLFLGFTTTFFLWYVFAPSDVSSILFSTQTATINSISGTLTGRFGSLGNFLIIFAHNVQVMMVCVLLSFFFGSGAIYILTWNASVLGAGMGNKFREGIAAASQQLGASGLGEYFTSTPVHFLAYLIHGVPEILAYVVGGVMGGTLSFAYVKGQLHSDMKWRIVEDMFVLTLVGLSLLVVAGMLEVYVSPNFL